jgi:hypothetical protein
MLAIVSLDSPSCEVPCLILHSVIYQDVTRQAKGLHRLKYVGALKIGLAYLSRCNSGWFCHSGARVAVFWTNGYLGGCAFEGPVGVFRFFSAWWAEMQSS